MTNGGTWQPPQPDATPPPSGGAFGPPTQVTPIGDAPTAVFPTVEAAPNPPGRSKGKVIGAAVGAVAIVAAGAFAITRFTDDSAAAGGADSPEAAGEAFLAAIDNEDALGMIDVLLPGERETLGGPATDLIEELTRLEVLSDDASLSGVDGIDLVVESQSVETRPTNVDDIVNVDITAAISGSVEGESLPIGDWIRENLDEDLSELDSESPEPTPDTLPLTAVRKDGRWYLSLFYTAAESAREETGQEIPAEGVTPTGGDSPEAAMDAFLDGVEGLDLGAVIASLNPDEFEALQRYAPLFLDDAQAALDDAAITMSISDRDYEVTGSGDTRSVTVAAITLEASAEGETVSMELRDGCWLVTSNTGEDDVNSCEVADEMPQLDEVLEDPQAVEDLLDSFQATFEDYVNPGLIVKEVDGTWYFSPLATGSEQVLAVVRALSRDEIEQLQEQITDVIGSIEEDVQVGGIDIPSLDDFERPGDDDATDTTVVPSDDTRPTDDSIDGESAPADDSVPAEDADAADGSSCYGEADALDAAACFEEVVAAGGMDADEVPFFVRWPECGLAEVGWSGDYYTLPDAEFVAVVEEAAPCFEDLVASGEVDADDVPVELAHPECLDGRNWLTATDDAYNDAFFECAFG
ncbi:MAG: hypothetical protein ABW219_13295 [Ilumatobacteraceae bacterium]